MKYCTIRYRFREENTSRGKFGSGVLSNLNMNQILENDHILVGKIIKKEDDIYIIHIENNPNTLKAIRYDTNSGLGEVMSEQAKSVAEYENNKINIVGFEVWDLEFETQISVSYNSNVANISSFGHYNNLNEEFCCSGSIIFTVDDKYNLIIYNLNNKPVMSNNNNGLKAEISGYNKTNNLNVDGLYIRLGTYDKINKIKVNPYH